MTAAEPAEPVVAAAVVKAEAAVLPAGAAAGAGGYPRFTVYSRPGCVWCERAKAALAARGLAWTEIPDADADAVATRTGRAPRSWPQVFCGRRHLGGCRALLEFLDEPLLRPDHRRFTPFPLRYPDLWDLYKRAVASFWTADEVSLAQDTRDWATLTPDERAFVKMVLAFFAGADGIVMENIQVNFSEEIQVAEARQFLAYQAFNEAEHARQYAILLETLVADPAERARLFDAIATVPAVRAKAAWAAKWLDPDRRFAERLLAFVCVEGVLFSGSFCAVFWLKHRGLMPGLGLSNQFISRDEGLHQEFGTRLYGHLRHKLTEPEAHDIVREAVAAELDFVREAVPVRLVGMNADLMAQYVRFVADRLLASLGYAPAFAPREPATNPFPWMDLISLAGKDNFFERFSSEYARAGVMADAPEDRAFATDAEF